MDVTRPTKPGLEGSNPSQPTIAFWKNKPLDKYSKDELIDIITILARSVESRREEMSRRTKFLFDLMKK